VRFVEEEGDQQDCNKTATRLQQDCNSTATALQLLLGGHIHKAREACFVEEEIH